MTMAVLLSGTKWSWWVFPWASFGTHSFRPLGWRPPSVWKKMFVFFKRCFLFLIFFFFFFKQNMFFFSRKQYAHLWDRRYCGLCGGEVGWGWGGWGGTALGWRLLLFLQLVFVTFGAEPVCVGRPEETTPCSAQDGRGLQLVALRAFHLSRQLQKKKVKHLRNYTWIKQELFWMKFLRN